jgi:hypothetical protein
MGQGQHPLVEAVSAQARLQNRLARATLSGTLGAVLGRDGNFGQLRQLQTEAQGDAGARQGAIRALIAEPHEWSDDELLALVGALDSFGSWSFGGLDHVPVESIAKLIARAHAGREPPPPLRRRLLDLSHRRLRERAPAESRRAAAILAELAGERPDYAFGTSGGIDRDDDWGAAAIAALGGLGDRPAGWDELLAHAGTATASKPAKKWLATAGERIEALGEDEFRSLAATLLGALDAPASGEMRRGAGIGALAGLDHVPKAVPTERNALVLRGIVWCCSLPGGPELAALVAGAARACSKKVPDVGARSPKVLNACLWTLAALGEEGAPHLVELSHKARKPAQRGRIDRALDSAAGAAGISREALEVGAVQNAAPAVQLRYFERALASGAEWPWARFREKVLEHPQLSAVAAPLIVDPGAGNGFLAGGDLPDLPGERPVRLWHPAGRPVADVVEWRELLERDRVVQPFKQAHREVYLLTQAEREARVQSARFAGHLLRQHTLRALCDARGWTYRLQGPFDPGLNPNPALRLPQQRLVAELAVDPVDDRTLQSGHGIFLYVQTGTLAFWPEPATGTKVAPPGTPPQLVELFKLSVREPVALAEVPPLALSEVLRDVDLFVSVAGVAADPEFPLNAPEPWVASWREQAFEQLTPLGAGRRELLERIIPALPIADRLSLEDRFLVVRGNLHHYRIHLGSANVMLEPGSRHVCILVAGGRRRPGEPGYVWLPFEGDDTLAAILSKAILLAADDRIADPSIRAQIRGL